MSAMVFSIYKFLQKVLLLGIFCFSSIAPASSPNVNSSAIMDSPDICILEENIKAAGLVDVQSLGFELQVDLRYSSSNNFVSKDVYGCLSKAYLQKEPAEKLRKAALALQKARPELTFVIFDAARPLSVQQALWDNLKKPESQKHVYVANPKRGSIHNYGAALDLSLAYKNGSELDMGTSFDYFGLLAQPRCEATFLKSGELSEIQVANRKLLRKIMRNAGFLPITSEWWHFNSCSLAQAKKLYQILP